ncbi:hypothetical protein K2173_003067 [Erythroxylum novogranatense]|uniref:Autophagy-related protein 18g n=1 Tax=Erythroxylum novogranatense TaxID=1862640 RepID=A0AAV8S8R4_9ROSI|nr:hypothetical protein K2173_003067 [Erythroxylum novogranatense]
MKKGKSRNNGLLPNSLRIISSCLKTVSTNATTTVRSASASVASSISTSAEDRKDQVTWAGFDKLDLSSSVWKHVLLLGYQNGFQVLDVEDASNFMELVSKRDGPVSFLQMQPLPSKSDGHEGFISLHPLLLVVAGDDTTGLNFDQNLSHQSGLGRESNIDSQLGSMVNSPTSVRFYSLRSHCYVHVLRFRSAVLLVRCSPHIVAVGLATQIYCIDAVTLENKFSVLTYPVPHLAGQGTTGVNVGYGPMTVGPRWLAYASNGPCLSNTSRLNPQNFSSSPSVSPSTSPGGNSLVARYAVESSKQLAAGIINLGDMGYRTFSKYCQELLPDGSNSPVSSSSGWKVGRLPGTDMDNAGVVVVKDFVSRAVISQFKAHTSPISALCFDRSGTLLVTASVYGNNINIFRIMPSRVQSGRNVENYDWDASYAHLYRLHRGITSALIQDICFSHYSQWIGIVSSKGTCHVFVLSPFGGDAGFQSFNSMGEDPSLFPVLSLPWWSTSSYTITHCPLPTSPSPPPPPPVSLSVVSRIKYSSFGWLNIVGNATGSATGKVFVPSGAVAAMFHNSVSQNNLHVNSRVKALEYLLVYTPSGHVVQHELLPSVGPEPVEGSRVRSSSYVHIQEDDLKVKVEPVQWWDVCRRSDWPEREECMFGSTNGHEAAEINQDDLGCEDSLTIEFLDVNYDVSEKKTGKACSVKSHDGFHCYLSNAEVQISSGRLPIWQKSKISFYVMDLPWIDSDGDGELEIEKVPGHEIEIKQKQLLPVFDHFHNLKTGLLDRGLSGLNCAHSSSELFQAEGKPTQETIICHSKPASLSSTESSECGSSRRIEHLLDLDQINCEKPCIPACQTMNGHYQETKGFMVVESNTLNQTSFSFFSSRLQHPKNMNADNANCSEIGLPGSDSYLPPGGRTLPEESPISNIHSNNGVSMLVADNYGRDANVPKLETENPVNLGLYFREGHCKAGDLGGCRKSTEVMSDDVDGSISYCEKEKPDEEGESNEFLGGVFPFSDEV